MKKTSAGLFLLFMLAHCKSGEKRNAAIADSTQGQSNMVTTNTARLKLTPALSDYQAALTALPVQKKSIRKALELFKTNYLSKDSIENDGALQIFLSFQEQLVTKLNDSFSTNADYEKINALVQSDSAYKALTTFAEALEADGLTYTSEEGNTYLMLNSGVVENYFLSTLSSAGETYLNEFSWEMNEPAVLDGGLAINERELAVRLGVWNEFIARYPKNVFYGAALSGQRYYRGILLQGTDNKPSFDYETKKVDDSFLYAYQYYVKRFPSTEDAAVIQTFLDLLSKSNFIKNDAIEAFIGKYNPY